MADPVGTTASIIAVLQLSSEVIKYISGIAGATKDRKRLREELRSCEFILQQLKDDADDTDEGKRWSETIKALEGPDAPLGRLWIALGVIKAKLEPRNGLERTLVILKWPFTRVELERIISAIEREKSLLQLALTNNSCKLILEIRTSSRENKMKLAELIKTIENKSSEHDKQNFQLTQQIQAGWDESKKRLLDLQASIDGLNQNQDDNHQQTILKWLTPVDYTLQQNDFVARRQEGTGQWLLESIEFQTWLETDRQTLFCPGIPGAGKTILTSIVVKELAARFYDDKSIGIAYLYCNFRRQDEQKVDDLLASLLKQLAETQPSLPSTVKDLYDRHKSKRTRPLVDELSRALQSVAALYSRVLIIVDALDECNASCRKTLLSELFSLQAKCRVNLFVTSRFIPEIIGKFQGSISLEIRASKGDIGRYLDAHMENLSSFEEWNGQLLEEIKGAISDAVDGMFLLAQIYLSSLDDKTTTRTVRNALMQLRRQSPSSSEDEKREIIYEAYKNTMERINGQKPGFRRLAEKVLSWISCANRPLTILELQHALAVVVGDYEHDIENIDQIERIVSVCAGLVTVDEESSIIRLVHYTTQEFFEQTQAHWFPYAEAEITTVCITYLSFNVFELGFCQTDNEFEERLRAHPFFENQAGAMIHLFNNKAKVEALSQGLLARKFYALHSNYSQEVPRKLTGLHLAAYFGAEFLAKLLLESGSSLESEDHNRRTPLSWAVENGFKDVVQLLLEQGAKLESKDRTGRTPLSWAARGNYKDVVQLLLEKGSDPWSEDNDGRTPLSWAAGGMYKDIVLLLLEKGSDPWSEDNDGRTPLSWAAGGMCKDIVQLLLEKGSDLESEDFHGRTPLSWAAENWKGTPVINLLLEKGSNVESKDDYGRTPLSWAAGDGNRDIVQLLLEKCADPESKDNSDRTPLSWAAAYWEDPANWEDVANWEETSVINLLLEKGAKLESKDDCGCTPLSWAAKTFSDTSVQLLLKKGADFESKDYSCGRTPLSWAAGEGNGAIVLLLLEKGADLESKDYGGRTPLSWAASYREETTEVTQLLLEKGAKLESKDHSGLTPLAWAAQSGNKAIINQLVTATQVDINSKDKSGRSPLTWAAREGNEAIVNLLLATDQVDIDAKDRFNTTPLSIAARLGRIGVVALLLPKSQALNVPDNFGRTPLWWARKNGHCSIAKLFLERFQEDNIIIPEDLPNNTTISSLDDESARFCDVCYLDILNGDTYYCCEKCVRGGFDICHECFAMNAYCLDEFHILVEK